MGKSLVFLGLFLLFTLVFNGGVGTVFVDYSFFASALFMIAAGVLKTAKPKSKIVRYFCAAALVSYIPMIWQRINFTFDTDWVGFGFDAAIILFLLVVIAVRHDSSIERAEP